MNEADSKRPSGNHNGGIHDAAARGFEIGTESYERGRPDYPAAALSYLMDELGVSPSSCILDLAAGTGKLTRSLVAADAKVLAVEPVAGMRAKFSALLPHVRIVEGRAEALPLPECSVDSVVVAQAFHWFDGGSALAEIHRVLKPGGKLALVWNVRNEACDWMFQLTKMLNPFERGTPQYRNGRWREAFGRTNLFSPLKLEQFENPQRGTEKTVLDRVASISFVSILPEEERASLLSDVQHLISTHPMTAGRAEFEIPYRTDVYTCSRRD